VNTENTTQAFGIVKKVESRLFTVNKQKAQQQQQQQQQQQEMSGEQWKRLIRETQAVSLWSCTCLIFRLSVDILMALSSLEKDFETESFNDGVDEQLKESILWLQQQKQKHHQLPFLSEYATAKTIMAAVSMFSSWIVYCFPSKVLFSQCPGFFFGNPM
jgi:hypothetical protein